MLAYEMLTSPCREWLRDAPALVARHRLSRAPPSIGAVIMIMMVWRILLLLWNNKYTQERLRPRRWGEGYYEYMLRQAAT
jgi:hypothetical protein